MSALPWCRLLELGCHTEEYGSKLTVHFPHTPAELTVEWTDGVLAGDMTPLTKLFELSAEPAALAQWHVRPSDAPSSLLPKLKTTSDASSVKSTA